MKFEFFSDTAIAGYSIYTGPGTINTFFPWAASTSKSKISIYFGCFYIFCFTFWRDMTTLLEWLFFLFVCRIREFMFYIMNKKSRVTFSQVSGLFLMVCSLFFIVFFSKKLYLWKIRWQITGFLLSCCITLVCACGRYLFYLFLSILIVTYNFREKPCSAKLRVFSDRPRLPLYSNRPALLPWRFIHFWS